MSNEQNVCLYYITSNKRFIIPLQKKLLFYNWPLFSGKSIQNILQFSHSDLFASASIRPVVNQLNQGTTVCYGLVRCAFS